uniref:ATPase AAA-type core domain-containing protein n=1 Tax=Oryza meridionalis TaxID=40149 RepID=A0A0E0FAJ4_9ORYZ
MAPSPTRLLHLPLLAPKPSPPRCLVSRRSRARPAGDAARCGCATEAGGGGGGGGSVVVEDDLYELLQVLPRDLRDNLQNEPRKDQLLEVILDLGRRPEARFLGDSGGQYLRDSEISQQELEEAHRAVGEFGGDNRAGIEGTLHRISAIRSRKGMVVGLTCRVGRAVTGHVDMVRDLLNYKESILFLGRPGVGKTTVMREIARVLADEFSKRVRVVGINSKDLSSYITATPAKELVLFIESHSQFQLELSRDAESWLVHWLTSGSNCHCYISQQEIKRLSCMAKCALACYYMLVPTASVLAVAGLHMPMACI